MSTDSRRLTGILLVVLPTVMYYAGALVLAIGVLTLGIGLIRKPKP